MIKQQIFLKKYNWKIVVLYNATKHDVEEIEEVLEEICDNKNVINNSTRYVKTGKLNTGFIYSNFDLKSSLIIIGKSDSKHQFINTVVHEANHLQSHIATVFNLNEKGEEVCYLIGGVVETMFKVFSKIIS